MSSTTTCHHPVVQQSSTTTGNLNLNPNESLFFPLFFFFQDNLPFHHRLVNMVPTSGLKEVWNSAQPKPTTPPRSARASENKNRFHRRTPQCCPRLPPPPAKISPLPARPSLPNGLAAGEAQAIVAGEFPEGTGFRRGLRRFRGPYCPPPRPLGARLRAPLLQGEPRVSYRSRDPRVACGDSAFPCAVHVIWALVLVLQVFEPVIKADLGLSAEEIETALVTNNRNLARIHVALLKVIYLSAPPRAVGSHTFVSDSCGAFPHNFVSTSAARAALNFPFKSGVCIFTFQILCISAQCLGDLTDCAHRNKFCIDDLICLCYHESL